MLFSILINNNSKKLYSQFLTELIAQFWIQIVDFALVTNTTAERKIGVSPRINQLDPHLFRERLFSISDGENLIEEERIRLPG